VKVTALEDLRVFTNAGSRCADSVFLATGKHDVRGAKRASRDERSDYVGFKMHWRPSARVLAELEGFVELILFDGGYAGLQLVAADVMNLCLIVKKQRLAETGGQWGDLLVDLMRDPALAHRIEDAEPVFRQPLAIANLPYGYICDPHALPSASVFRLGDQAAMTASLTGDGIAGALRSAHLAASCLMLGQTAHDYHRKVERLLSGQIRRAMMLQRVTESRHLIGAASGLLSLWPGLLGTLAARTRLPERQPV
jgi:flavin-dependent dehydrogenase